MGGGSWFTATHKSGLVQNNQSTSLGLVWTGFFLKQKHMLIDGTFFFLFFFFCRFMLILMNCLCKNKSFIPMWILFRWLQGKSHYFGWNDLSFQIVEYNWKLKTVRTQQDGLVFSNKILWVKVNLFFQCFNNYFYIFHWFHAQSFTSQKKLPDASSQLCALLKEQDEGSQSRSKPQTPPVICYCSCIPPQHPSAEPLQGTNRDGGNRESPQRAMESLNGLEGT